MKKIAAWITPFSLHSPIINHAFLFRSYFTEWKSGVTGAILHKYARGGGWMVWRVGLQKSVSALSILNFGGIVGEFPLVRTRKSECVQENFSGSLGVVLRVFRIGCSKRHLWRGVCNRSYDASGCIIIQLFCINMQNRPREIRVYEHEVPFAWKMSKISFAS